MMLLVQLIFLCIGLTSATTYWVTVKTSGLGDSGTDSAIYVKILGNGRAVSSQLETSGHNDFKAGHVDKYQLGLGDVGKIRGLEMSTGGSDAFLFDWVSVRSSSDTETKYFYNVNKQWLSKDSGEGVAKVTLSLQGDKTYIVSTKTGTISNAGSSNLGLSMILEGQNGNRAYTSYLEPKEGSFDKGALDVFELQNLPDLGTVKCVTLQAADTNAWYFDVIVVQEKGSEAVLFSNKYQKFLSADYSEGMTSMKLCA